MASHRLEPVSVFLLIGGDWIRGSGDELVHVNPAHTSEVVSVVRRATEADLQAAVHAAERARSSWRATSWHERAGVLHRAADLLDQRADGLGVELTCEEGKTLREGVGEIHRAARIFRYFAGEADHEIGEVYASSRAGETILSVRNSVGVIAVITPWNFPIAIPAWKIAPALAYGNTVVWKPSELVPLLAYRLAQALVDAGLPGGVLNLVIGPGSSIGRSLTQHSGVDGVTFTGSTPIGRSIVADCGRAAKPVQAEMGGKNVAIVLADASIPDAAEQVVRGAMESTGQKCTATSRLVVEESIADRLLEEVSRRIETWRVGDGLAPDVDMGPAVSAQAQTDIFAAVDSAIREGARVVAKGTTQLGRGNSFFVTPNVLAVADASAGIWRDEVFGPVLTVLRAGSWPECADVANATPYGLTASLFTNDLGKIMDAIDRLEVGIVHVNSETTGAEPHVPFGGSKASGYGPREQGRAAREFFSRTKTVYLRPIVTA